jgi:hypothetical protein
MQGNGDKVKEAIFDRIEKAAGREGIAVFAGLYNLAETNAATDPLAAKIWAAVTAAALAAIAADKVAARVAAALAEAYRTRAGKISILDAQSGGVSEVSPVDKG